MPAKDTLLKIVVVVLALGGVAVLWKLGKHFASSRKYNDAAARLSSARYWAKVWWVNMGEYPVKRVDGMVWADFQIEETTFTKEAFSLDFSDPYRPERNLQIYKGPITKSLILLSVGPDGKIDLDPAVSGTGGLFIQYDPTNGSSSAGDIVIWEGVDTSVYEYWGKTNKSWSKM